jgi:hypothetical protein
MADENKDLSVEQAQKIIEENKDVNSSSLPEEPLKEVQGVEDEDEDSDKN